VLGLRHEDIAAAEREITVVPRENANGTRAKSGGRTVPVGGELIRLYADYLHEEYGGIDSDYVFVNLFAGPRGQAWSYPAVYDLVGRLRARTGLDFDPHWFRHSDADSPAERGRVGQPAARGRQVCGEEALGELAEGGLVGVEAQLGGGLRVERSLRERGVLGIRLRDHLG
jgi:hypothetical protein